MFMKNKIVFMKKVFCEKKYKWKETEDHPAPDF